MRRQWRAKAFKEHCMHEDINMIHCFPQWINTNKNWRKHNFNIKSPQHPSAIVKSDCGVTYSRDNTESQALRASKSNWEGRGKQGETWGIPTEESTPEQNKGSPEGCPESQERRQRGEGASKGRGQIKIKEEGDKSKPQQKVNSHIEMVKITYFYCNWEH